MKEDGVEQEELMMQLEECPENNENFYNYCQ